MEKIAVLPVKARDQWGMESLAYDLKIRDASANLNDYVQALSHFAAAHMEDCKGCDGCCHERAPLISSDIPALTKLLPQASQFPFHEVIESFCELKLSADGCVDITLRRPKGDCIFLDQGEKFCKEHASRPFVCRSHFCLPQSARAQELRTQIVNAGEDELVRLLLSEEKQGAPLFLNGIKGEDYPPSSISGKDAYTQILLKNICSQALWLELFSF